MNGKDRKEAQRRYSSYIPFLDGMAEVVIWDGTSDWTDAFQTVMTAKAEVTACLLTADVKGTALFQTVSGQNPTANALSAVGRT